MLDGLAGVKHSAGTIVSCVPSAGPIPTMPMELQIRISWLHAGLPEVRSNTWRVGFDRNQREKNCEVCEESRAAHLSRFSRLTCNRNAGSIISEADGATRQKETSMAKREQRSACAGSHDGLSRKRSGL